MSYRHFALCAGLMLLAACSDNAPADSEAKTTNLAGSPGNLPPPAPVEVSPVDSYTGPIPMPIMIGSDGPDLDACGTYGEVANLDPQGDNFLSVRDAPSVSTKERDRLDTGQAVSVCDSADGWLGIVYSKTGEDCDVGSPVDSKQPYRGPCSQGWVASRFVTIIAG